MNNKHNLFALFITVGAMFGALDIFGFDGSEPVVLKHGLNDSITVHRGNSSSFVDQSFERHLDDENLEGNVVIKVESEKIGKKRYVPVGTLKDFSKYLDRKNAKDILFDIANDELRKGNAVWCPCDGGFGKGDLLIGTTLKWDCASIPKS